MIGEIVKEHHPADEFIAFVDFSDPLSYVISTQIEGWCAGSGFTVCWAPLSRLSTGFGDDWNQRLVLANSLAQAFRYPLFPRQDLDSLPALRASMLARKRGSLSQFIMRVFQFWYATDLPPYADILFDGLAEDCGLPKSELEAALKNEQHWTSRALLLANEQVGELGVQSIPCLVTPHGTKIEVYRLNPTRFLEELLDGLASCGLSSQIRTPASRCYLPSDTDQPEQFCRWCTCGKRPS